MMQNALLVKRWRNLGFVALLTFAGASVANAADGPVPDSQQPSISPQDFMPDPPKIAATSWVLMDAASGDVIYAHDEHKRLPPASLTKLMTAYLAEYEMAAGRLHGDDQALVSEHAWRTGGSRMFLKPNTRVSIDELMSGIVVQSGNDAAVTMAEHIGGSEDSFAQLMNQHAQMLGLKDTHFVNATGLPHDNHYSSAYDLAELSRHITDDYPEHYKLYKEKEFVYNGIRQPNRNLLLWRDKRIDGLKTGHTDAAGYCMVASGTENGSRMIAVVLGTTSEAARAQETLKLISYGFRYFHTRKLFDAGHVVQNARVWGGANTTVPVGFPQDVYVTLPQNKMKGLSQRVEMESDLDAPISKGQVLGKLSIVHDGEVVTSRPLVALEADDEGGFIRKGWDSIVRTVTGWF
ncbi:D-alanyl-D-alanine carboxypeptidase family protein [Carnimonas nigrificans]|uniref:D-alanyl-D-alanine carboxypeptidase family protein n=1 Tax=Carnimonas nigrificans TaxID=64323 RepID=UPI00046E6327|nr:D-alanyl-D-alanine carboxypeptidase family protein [Carnimonas nigrificans]